MDILVIVRPARLGDYVEIDGAKGGLLLVVDAEPDCEMLMVSWRQNGKIREGMVPRSCVNVVVGPRYAR